MAEERFDLSYKGDLAPGADPASVRERLTAVFKLSAAGAERLFTGRPVILKRNADAVAAARFTEVFEQAGAILTVTPLTTESGSEAPDNDTDAASAPDRIPPPRQVSRDRATDAATLSLAAQDGFLEEPRTVNIAAFDTGGLNLVSGRRLEPGGLRAATHADPDTRHRLSLARRDGAADRAQRSRRLTHQPMSTA